MTSARSREGWLAPENLAMRRIHGNFSGWFLALLPLVCCTHLADAVESPKLALALLAAGYLLARDGLPLSLPRSAIFRLYAGFWLAMCMSFCLNGLWEGLLAIVQTGLGVLFAWLWLSPRPQQSPAVGDSDAPPSAASWSRVVVWGWWGSIAYSWVQRLGLDPLAWSHPELSSVLTIAGLGNPNFLGFYLAVLAPLAWLESQGKLWTGFLWLLGAAALLLSGTRASALAFALSLLVLGAGAWRWHRQLLRPWALTILALLVMLPLLRFVPLGGLGAQTAGQVAADLKSAKADSVETRKMLWRAALAEAAQRPVLGWGEGWFPYRALLHRYREPMEVRLLQRLPENPHNQYFDILVHCGLIGLSLYCATGLLALRRGWQAAQRNPTGLALLAALGAYALNSFFIDATLTVQLTYVWLLVAVEPPVDSSALRSLAAGRALAIALLAAALAVVTCEVCLWQGDDDPRQAEHYYRIAIACAPPWRAKVALGKLIHRNTLVDSKEMVRRYPEDPFQWAALASQAERLGLETDKISGYWSEALLRDPFNPRFHFDYGSWLGSDKVKDYPLALAEINRSLVIYPTSVEFLHQKAVLLRFMGRAKEALEVWRQAAVFDPANPTLHFAYSEWLSRQGNFPQALQEIDTCLQLRPDVVDALSQKAAVLHSLGRDREATALWPEAIARAPHNLFLHSGFSRWLWKVGEYAQALEEIEICLKSYPEEVDFLFQRALVLHSLGREEEAAAAWREVLRKNPELEEKRPW